MRNKTVFGLTALLCLLLLSVQWLWAETNTGLVDTPRTREIRANVPQTPEELLQVLKEFMDNPQMDGFELGEKLLGMARENWGGPAGVFGRGLYSEKQVLYVPLLRGNGQKGPPYKWQKPLTPYELDESEITLDENDNLLSLGIVNFKKDFCMTPGITREILREPSKVFVGGNGGLILDYIVNRSQEYKIAISYKSEYINNGPSRITVVDGKEKIAIALEKHKASCANTIRIHRIR